MKKHLMITLLVASVVVSTAMAQLCQYPGSYFLYNDGVNIVDVRLQHQVVGGNWANIVVTESSRILIKDVDYHPGQYYAFFPEEFYLIAVTDDDTINCPYWAAEMDDRGRGDRVMDQEWSLKDWYMGSNTVFIIVHGHSYDYDNGSLTVVDTAWIARDTTVIPRFWQYQYSTTGLIRDFVWQAVVPEGDSVTIHFGNDIIAYEYLDTTWQAELSDTLWGEGLDNCGRYWGSWGAYLRDPNGYGMGAWDSYGPFFVLDPQPAIGIPGEVHFVSYLCSTATGGITNGIDWLPDTIGRGKWIGLDFSFTDLDSQVSNRPVYEIFDITTWQGVNLNTPLIAPRPTAVGDCTYFDYWVYNPLINGQPKYTIRTIDEDHWLDDLGAGWGERRPTVDTISTRRYTVQRNADVLRDTLWLMCRDFAAHALVLPRTGQTTSLRLRNRVSPYDGLPLWSISVPRDDDGYRTYGTNRGDFMADAWEEKVFGVPRFNSAILRFRPFYYGIGPNFIFADLDTSPRGRNIRGDRFTNWEEYRGFMVTGNPDTASFTTLQFRRADPWRKTVMVDWEQIRPDTSVSKVIPAWLSQLTSPANTSLDIKFVNLNLDPLRDRFTTKRIVNPNQYGAYFPYFGVPKVTNRPATFNQNAVSWWTLNQDERDWFRRQGGNYDIRTLGLCWPDTNEFRAVGYVVPEFHSRIIINSRLINSYRTKPFYTANPNRWPAERDSLYRNVMTHEFGHSIGMMHLEDNHIMKQFAPINANGQFFWDPLYTPAFSNSNKGQISTRRPQ